MVDSSIDIAYLTGRVDFVVLLRTENHSFILSHGDDVKRQGLQYLANFFSVKKFAPSDAALIIAVHKYFYPSCKDTK